MHNAPAIAHFMYWISNLIFNGNSYNKHLFNISACNKGLSNCVKCGSSLLCQQCDWGYLLSADKCVGKKTSLVNYHPDLHRS